MPPSVERSTYASLVRAVAAATRTARACRIEATCATSWPPERSRATTGAVSSSTRNRPGVAVSSPAGVAEPSS